MELKGMYRLKQVVDDGQGNSRLSGNGAFPAPTKKDIGRAVVEKRRCLTWEGMLGYFLDDTEKTTYAFWVDELE